ncbi:hypothetical protein C7B62_08610 [Pleurocapsa sp. CCALA 161]|uniref:hypothetical protein n=1 Tax=Pleurocapsa sp. CCALA 161 TaxID=2107688 RepID=UPI000D0682B7|nr:hypothetical protein [Pleurocapsa sp. CCALA 161]PSB10630.1 hypothetical protein C7B62_08610 [Pleurocapsa sp. CCALA 161]
MNKHFFQQLVFSSVIAVSFCTAFTPAQATKVPVKYELVSTEDAIKGAIPITLYFGKVISIDFTEVRETITFIAPSDKSQFVYNTDLPVESGEAQTAYLLPSKKLDFQSTYQTSHPNLIVKTINSSGESKQYNLIVSFSSGIMASAGIKFVPSNQQSPVDSQKIMVSAEQQINADAVEHGLRIAIAKQFINSNDPVVNNVRNFVFLLRNGHSVNDALVATQINPSVIESLGEIYLEAELPSRF